MDVGLPDVLLPLSWIRFQNLVAYLPSDASFWLVANPVEDNSPDVNEEIRQKHREKLHLGPPPTFPHRPRR